MRVVRRHKTRKEFTSRLVGRKITKVERRGKYLLMTLDSGEVLVTHFGMSGQFHRGTGRVAMPAHTHVVLTFQQRGDLRYVDPRTFGEMFVATADELGKVKELQHLAIDPLDQVFTWPTFQFLPADRASKMKQLLMDQKFIAGLGNIYSDEVLFHAGIRFDRMSDALSLTGGARGSIARCRRCCRKRSSSAARRSTTRPTATCSATRASTGGAQGLRPGGASVPALQNPDREREESPSGTRSTAHSARAEPALDDLGAGVAHALHAAVAVTRLQVDRADRVEQDRRRVAEASSVDRRLDDAVVGGEPRDHERWRTPRS